MALTDTFDIESSGGIKPNSEKEKKLYNGCTEQCYQNHNEWHKTVICKNSKLSQGCPSNEKYNGRIKLNGN